MRSRSTDLDPDDLDPDDLGPGASGDLDLRLVEDVGDHAVADELALGAAPRRPPRRLPSPARWSPRRRALAGAAAAVVVAGAVTGWAVLRPDPPAAPVAGPTPNLARAPGADVTVTLAPERTACPPGRVCTYPTRLTGPVEAAFRASFPSAGWIGRGAVVDADTGRVYLQRMHFTTGTLVSITLLQRPVALLDAPPPPDDLTPTRRDLDSGSLTLTVVRDDWLMTAVVAGLPGQVLPVTSVRRWLETVPAPMPDLTPAPTPVTASRTDGPTGG